MRWEELATLTIIILGYTTLGWKTKMKTHLGDHECNSTHQRGTHDTDSPKPAIARARILGFAAGLAVTGSPSAAPGIGGRHRWSGCGLVGVTGPCILGNCCSRSGYGFIGITSPLAAAGGGGLVASALSIRATRARARARTGTGARFWTGAPSTTLFFGMRDVRRMRAVS